MTESDSNSSKQPSRWLADISLAIVALIWGVNMPVMKFALGRMDEYLFNALRLSFSALVLGLLVGWRSWKNRSRSGTLESVSCVSIKEYSRRQWLNVIWFSFLAGFAYQICFLLGIDRTTAGNTAIIMSAIPVWTAVLAFVILGDRLKRGAWIGLLVALGGVLIVTFGKPASSDVASATSSSGGELVGNLIVSVAALAWALASVVSRPLMKSQSPESPPISPLDLAFFSVALSAPFHFMVAGSAVYGLVDVASDPTLLCALVYSGVFSTGLAYAMWNFGVKQLGAAHAAGFQNLVPLVALVAAWLLIAEVPFLMQIVGGALILVGLATMRSQR